MVIDSLISASSGRPAPRHVLLGTTQLADPSAAGVERSLLAGQQPASRAALRRTGEESPSGGRGEGVPQAAPSGALWGIEISPLGQQRQYVPNAPPLRLKERLTRTDHTEGNEKRMDRVGGKNWEGTRHTSERERVMMVGRKGPNGHSTGNTKRKRKEKTHDTWYEAMKLS